MVLADKDGSEVGLTKNEIESAFNKSKIELLSLTVPFSMNNDDIEMPVLMALGKNI